MRKLAAKVVLSEPEWVRSLEESHPDTDARAAAVETHRREVAVLRQALEPWLAPLEALRETLSTAADDSGCEDLLQWFE